MLGVPEPWPRGPWWRRTGSWAGPFWASRWPLGPLAGGVPAPQRGWSAELPITSARAARGTSLGEGGLAGPDAGKNPRHWMDGWMLKTTQEAQGTQACDTASPQCPCECHPRPHRVLLGPPRTASTTLSGPGGNAGRGCPWSPGSRGQPAEAAHSGSRWSASAQAWTAGGGPGPRCLCCRGRDLGVGEPTVPPLPCALPVGAAGGRLSAECPAPFPRHGPAGQTASTGQRYTLHGCRLRGASQGPWHLGLAPSSADASGMNGTSSPQ
nr:PREDICTED: collagen alpha-1(I) chain-like [Rhinolophus sinicus]